MINVYDFYLHQVAGIVKFIETEHTLQVIRAWEKRGMGFVA
jgi:hypothetical protein